MTTDEMRVAVGEAVGYQLLPLSQNPSQKTWQKGGATCVLPDYTNDLNAIRGAEQILDSIDEEGGYLCTLEGIVTGRKCWKLSEANIAALWSATAAQRCEGLLRVLGRYR